MLLYGSYSYKRTSKWSVKVQSWRNEEVMNPEQSSFPFCASTASVSCPLNQSQDK